METMQIECVLQRAHPKTGRPGTIVPFDAWPTLDGPFATKPPTPARVYEFKPVDGSDPTSPHVCRDVLLEHAYRLLECNGGYRIYDDGAAATARPIVTEHVQKIAPVTGDDPDAQKPKSIAQVPDAQRAQALEAAVKAIREMPVKVLKDQVNTLDRDALRAAYDIEEQIKTAERRKGFLGVVGAHLGLITT